MAGWHQQCNGHELGQILGDDEGLGGLACCSPWDRRDLDKTGRLNNNNRGKRKEDQCHQALMRMWGSVDEHSLKTRGQLRKAIWQYLLMSSSFQHVVDAQQMQSQ